METDCFNNLLLAAKWWIHGAGVLIWAFIVVCFLMYTAKRFIRAYPLNVIKWVSLLTPKKRRNLILTAILALIPAGALIFGLLTWQTKHRKDVYADAVTQWERYVAIGDEFTHPGLKKIAAAAGDDRGKGFVSIGKAICAGFPKLSAANKLKIAEMEALEPLMAFWLGAAPTDMIVQGHTDAISPHWQGRLPKVGVTRPSALAIGGVRWSCPRLPFLKGLISMSQSLVGPHSVMEDANPDPRMSHPAEMSTENLVALLKGLRTWTQAIAKIEGGATEDVELSECMNFWRAVAVIILRYEMDPAPGGGILGMDMATAWSDVQRWIQSQKGAENDTAWIYGQLKIQVYEYAHRAKSEFSPWRMEAKPLRVTDGTGEIPADTLARRFLQEFIESEAAYEKGQPVTPRTLAAVIAAEHIYFCSDIYKLLGMVNEAKGEQRKTLTFLRKFTRMKGMRELWDDLFESHGWIVEGRSAR
jgi:hypothetical protein